MSNEDADRGADTADGYQWPLGVGGLGSMGWGWGLNEITVIVCRVATTVRLSLTLVSRIDTLQYLLVSLCSVVFLSGGS